ncbi:Phenylalanine--tRNA ligase beta subunit [uncultured Gammaproteobacteria bacterium]
MKFPLSWLKDHLETEAGLDRITETLTALGLEVEGVTDRAKPLAPFTIARVISAERHPNADKLQVCMVDPGNGAAPVQVVCGAPNARAGLRGVFAQAGAIIPNSATELKKGVIRGVESCGMLCSERELNLSEEHNGIIELPDDAPLGGSYARYLGLDDPLIEIALTPDRADCAGVRGIARDLAAAGLGRLKPLTGGKVESSPVQGSFRSPIGVSIEEPQACPLFIGRFIKGIRNGSSPRWLRDKLLAIGLRPISILVDLTNYLTMDIARPLHVFDADTLAGGIIVRLSRAGEPLKALNGKDYVLEDGMTVIADFDGVLGLAGIVGGEPSGCTEDTVNVFVECALFDPVRTAATGRKLAIDSDARYRFERGVDPGAAFEGMERITRLIVDLCGGEASELVVAGGVPGGRRMLTLRPTRVNHLGGVDVPLAEQRRILEALGFETSLTEDGNVSVAVPSWRADVHGEADLVEEVLRINGFDQIPVVPLPRTVAVTRPALNARQRRTSFIRRTLAARGLNEAVTWSFMSSAFAPRFGHKDEGLRLVNPISSDLDVLRPSILPNLIQAAGRNADRGYPDSDLFELGPVFLTAVPEGQTLVATGIRSGAAGPRNALALARSVDAYDAKADALAALEAAGVAASSLQITTDAPDWYHPGRSGVLRQGPAVLARFGELHPEALEVLGVKGPVVGFEVFVDIIAQPKRKSGTARPLLKLSPFQPVNRDFAFVVAKSVEADKVLRAARGADKALVKDAAVFDAYQGPGVPEGHKSLAIAVTLQPTTQTLTEQELEQVSARIVAAVAKATGGSLRG